MTFHPVESSNYPNLPDASSPVTLHPPIQKRRLSKWAIALLLLSLLTSGSYLAYRRLVISNQQTKQQMVMVPVERTNLSITIAANGTVEPERVINVSPKTAGVLKRLLVDEGDWVSQGQVMAYMDDSNLQGQLTQAQGQLAAANANLEKMLAGNRSQEIAQVQARLTSAQAKLKQAEDDLSRNQELFNAGAISRQVYDQAVTARDTAQAGVTEAQQALSLSQSGYRQEDIAAARAQVETATGALQTIQAQLNDTVIRAPISGMITRKYADPGAFVTPTTAGSSVSSATSSSILSLASQNQVVANVAESSISQIQVGQQVVIKADAYPGKTFQGRVTQIATEATIEQNVTSFEVEVALLSGADKILRSGMNVSVEFQVGQVQNAMTVPTVAVVQQQNVTGVFVAAANQQPVFTPITTGATVDNRTEVKAGLNGTEQVLIAPPPDSESQSGLSLPSLPGSASAGSFLGGAPMGAPPATPPQ
ncbi:MAG TPA: efflux RND transporter periplasmic adaptor subunit [Crinalium sp.]|jgi:HlyD family secretion protein